MSANEVDGCPQETNGRIEYAGFWLRLAAYLVDSLIIGSIGYILGKMTFPLWVSLVLSLAYTVGFNCSKYQGTAGKIFIGIKITDLSGKRITFWRALARYCFQHMFIFFQILCQIYWWIAVITNSPLDGIFAMGLLWVSSLVFIIGALMIAFTARKQALHDIVCGTLVVKAGECPELFPNNWRAKA